MKKWALVALMSMGIAAPAFADADYGLEVGIRQQSGKVDSATETSESKIGYQFGATVHIPVSGAFYLRSGMLYTQRPLISKTNSTGAKNEIAMNYLDVPVALMYKFEDYAGAFIGLSLGLHLNSSVETGQIQDEKSPLIPIILGASFKFAPQLGATIYYESASGEAAKGLKDYRAVGANLLITFD